MHRTFDGGSTGGVVKDPQIFMSLKSGGPTAAISLALVAVGAWLGRPGLCRVARLHDTCPLHE